MAEEGDDVNDAREELDIENMLVRREDVVKDGLGLPGPASGECGCISGPKYPNIGECDY